MINKGRQKHHSLKKTLQTVTFALIFICTMPI